MKIETRFEFILDQADCLTVVKQPERSNHPARVELFDSGLLIALLPTDQQIGMLRKALTFLEEMRDRQRLLIDPANVASNRFTEQELTEPSLDFGLLET